MKLLIMYCNGGYMITMENGDQMEFLDNDPTSGIKTLREAIDICVKNEYPFEIV